MVLRLEEKTGFNPCAGLLQARDGNLYGTASQGGIGGAGTVYRLDINAAGLSVLHSFSGSDGSDPRAALIQAADGCLYGTTTRGGVASDESIFGQVGNGTVFQITLDGALATLYSFGGAEDMFRWGDLGENLLLEDASLPETSIESCRGIESLDVNDAMLLVRAPVEQVAQAFSSLRHVDVWRRDAYERPVPGMALSFVVYQLRGHSWSVIWTLTEAPFMHGFDLPDAEALSRLLQTRAVLYTVSDTCCSIGYDLYEQGELVEKLFYEPGSEEDLAPSEFYSRLRPVQAHDIEDSYNFVEAFMLEQDIYVPALLNSYRGSAAFRLEGYRADRHIGDTSYSPDHFTRSDFERLDYLGIDKATLPAGEWQRLGANQYR